MLNKVMYAKYFEYCGCGHTYCKGPRRTAPMGVPSSTIWEGAIRNIPMLHPQIALQADKHPDVRYLPPLLGALPECSSHHSNTRQGKVTKKVGSFWSGLSLGGLSLEWARGGRKMCPSGWALMDWPGTTQGLVLMGHLKLYINVY